VLGQISGDSESPIRSPRHGPHLVKCSARALLRQVVAMVGSSRVKCRRALSGSAALAIAGILVLTAGVGRLNAQARDGSPGPLADSCGVPPASASAAGGGGAGGGRGTPVFPAGQYPVKLPLASLLGARNDLPNPYRAGVSWGQLPEGRRWGSTASVATAADGTIWVTDRCGISGAGGTTAATRYSS
jgi:hypothetical protein